MSARPVVDRLQIQYANRVRVVRVDVTTVVGRELGARYAFQFTPFFVGIARGQVMWRQRGRPPSTELLDQLIAN